MSRNPFSLLETDSDSDFEKDQQIHEAIQIVPMTNQNVPEVKTTNNYELKSPPTSPPFRVWKLTPEEEKARSVFNSPFSKGMNMRGRKPRTKYEKDKEGWVSIKKNQPNFNADSSDSEKEIKREMEVELESHTPPDFSLSAPGFPSLLMRGQNTPEQMTAHAWAEKVKQSLEKAEQARKQTSMTSQSSQEFAEALGKLSFFRGTPMSEAK
jgi:hypothetical protein